jgi:hypothetical protein
MWALLKKLFEKPNQALLEQEAYADGRACAQLTIHDAVDKSKAADELYYQTDGAMNTTKIEREFDRGVTEQLHAMGYQAPYQNGQF